MLRRYFSDCKSLWEVIVSNNYLHVDHKMEHVLVHVLVRELHMPIDVLQQGRLAKWMSW